MTLFETGFKGLLIIVPQVYEDERGYFMESFNQEVFNQFKLRFSWVQDNQSRSSYGVIRGLHYQIQSAAQAKLVRVVEGVILDVAVDLRAGQPTYGSYFSVELSADNNKQLLIPRGFAHGFSVLSDYATVLYKCDTVYQPRLERSIHPFDAELGIDWKIPKGDAILSPKDLANPTWRNAEYDF
jgi:dTDP-4-dehydrorhamnose 3,5-epimerase